MNDPTDRRALILEAADELFGDRGFDGVSMRDVAQHAGVNKALVFYYFGSKDQLFEQVLDRYYAAHADALSATALDPEAPLRERLHALVSEYLDFLEGHERYARMVQQQLTGHGGDLTFIERSLTALYRSVEATLGDVTPKEGPLAARHFFVTFSAAVINYFTYAPVLREVWEEDPRSAEAMAERRAHLHWLVDAIVAGLLAETETPGKKRGR